MKMLTLKKANMTERVQQVRQTGYTETSKVLDESKASKAMRYRKYLRLVYPLVFDYRHPKPIAIPLSASTSN